MNQEPIHHTRLAEGDPQPHTGQAAAEAAEHRASPTERTRERPPLRFILGELTRGAVWGGAAFLLGSCPLLLGTAPLGLALLAASSAYTLYILVGLLLSALFVPVGLGGWAWVGVYLLCLILRVVVRLFIDPPDLPDGRPCGGLDYLKHCGRSLWRNLGMTEGMDTADDYYEGRDSAAPPPLDAPLSPEERRRPFARLFAEHPFLRMLTAAVCGLVAGLFGMILSAGTDGHFHLYGLAATLFWTVTTPAAALLLVSCFGEVGMTLLFSPGKEGDSLFSGRGKRRYHALPLLSVTFLLTACVYAATAFRIPLLNPYLTLDTATLLGMTLTLLSTARLGVVAGLAVGGLCGVVSAPLLIPSYLLCAGVYALVRRVSHRTGIIAGGAVAAVYCAIVCVTDPEAGLSLLLRHLPALLLTVPLFLAAQRLGEVLPIRDRTERDPHLESFSAAISVALSAAMHAESRAEAQKARLSALSTAFGTLSERLHGLADQLKRPRMTALYRLCDNVFAERCATCGERGICWGAEYDRTLEAKTRIAAHLHAEGTVSVEDLPASLQGFCPRMTAIMTDVNLGYGRMSDTLRREEKTDVYAADYAAISRILAEALYRDGPGEVAGEEALTEEERERNRADGERIAAAIAATGVTVQGVLVSGHPDGRRRIMVRGRGFNTTAEGAAALRQRLENACHTRLALPVFDPDLTLTDPDAPKSDTAVVTLRSEPALRVRYAGSTVPCGHDRSLPLPSSLTHDTPCHAYLPPAVCGDHIALFCTEDACLYALISDGMGTGEDASLTSDICALFLEQLLSSGGSVSLSLRMLDDYLRAKNHGTGEECSATVDLLSLDLLNGQAMLIKCGAAPTYVVRQGSIYKLRARSLPIGILRDALPRPLRFSLRPGDVAVMVSDGVTRGVDDCPWLMELLSAPLPDDVDLLRENIIRGALERGAEDDVSAIAIRVEERVRPTADVTKTAV